MTERIGPLHCTACCDALGENVNHANDVQNVFGMEFKIATTDVWMFRKEIGLEVEFAQQQCDLTYQSMNITSHITLIVTKRTQSKGDWNNDHVSKGFARTSVCVGCKAEICGMRESWGSIRPSSPGVKADCDLALLSVITDFEHIIDQFASVKARNVELWFSCSAIIC